MSFKIGFSIFVLAALLAHGVLQPVMPVARVPAEVKSDRNGQRPLRIGILAHELTKNMKESLYEKLKGTRSKEELLTLFHTATQISSNYIKFAQMGGVEYYPILITDSIDLIIRQLRVLDGLLLPGGAPGFQFLEAPTNGRQKLYVKLNLRKRYFRKADLIIESAKYINKFIRPFAIFGICLGFEMMLLNESRFRVPLKPVDNQNINSVVSLTTEPTKFTNWLSKQQPNYTTLFNQGKQFFYNSKGISTRSFYANKRLSENYKIVSEATIDNDKYVSIVEHVSLPFFGVQFHPEKNMFDTSEYFKADHSLDSRRVSVLFQQYFKQLLGQPTEDVHFDASLFAGTEPKVLSELGFYKELLVYSRDVSARAVFGEL